MHQGRKLLADSQRFDVSYDSPSVKNCYGAGQRRLPTVRNAIADCFEEGSLRKGLYRFASQVGGEGIEALSYRSVPVVVCTVALGAESKIEVFPLLNSSGIIFFQGGC